MQAICEVALCTRGRFLIMIFQGKLGQPRFLDGEAKAQRICSVFLSEHI